jgi:hypothetical protein
MNPIHFSGAEHPSLFATLKGCQKPWPRHTFQSTNQASWEDLAYSILDAEQTIGRWLHYFVAPEWTIKEEHRYPKYLNRYFTNAINFNGQRPTINVQRGEIIAGGQRLATVIEEDVTVTYTDGDGDGFAETGTIVATIPGGVTVDDWREVQVFFVDTDADPRWEIRPIDSITISGSTITIVAPSWQFIEPDLHGAWPTSTDYVPVDVETVTPFAGTVDVYLVQNDTTATASRLMWQQRPTGDCNICSGVGCDECNYTTQDGCLPIGDVPGKVIPTPATYNGSWASAELTVCRSPDKVQVWYYSGLTGKDYLAEYSNDPLEEWLATAIAWLAIARLDREVCDCNNEMWERLQMDMAFVSPQGNFLTIAESIQQSPFGTKRGEWMAYQRVKFAKKFYTVAVL